MALSVQDLTFTLKYRPGPSNPSDVLSRQPMRSSTSSIAEIRNSNCINSIAENSTPRGREATQQDGTIQAALTALRGAEWDLHNSELRSMHGVKQELTEANGVLLRGERIVVPTSLRQAVLQLAHKGHQGEKRTAARLQVKRRDSAPSVCSAEPHTTAQRSQQLH
jgi:hypothetical protein